MNIEVNSVTHQGAWSGAWAPPTSGWPSQRTTRPAATAQSSPGWVSS